MTDTGIYATTTQVLNKCGSGASTYFGTEAKINDYISQAEGVVNVICRKVFADSSGAFVALPATTRGILTDCAASIAAINVITADMREGGNTKTEMEDRIVVLRDAALRDLSILRDKKMQDFVMTGVEN